MPARRVLLSLCSDDGVRDSVRIFTHFCSVPPIHTESSRARASERAYSRTIGHIMKYLYCKNDDGDECASLVIVVVDVVGVRCIVQKKEFECVALLVCRFYFISCFFFFFVFSSVFFCCHLPFVRDLCDHSRWVSFFFEFAATLRHLLYHFQAEWTSMSEFEREIRQLAIQCRCCHNRRRRRRRRRGRRRRQCLILLFKRRSNMVALAVLVCRVFCL